MNYGQNIRFTVVANVAASQFRGMTVAGSYGTTGLTFHGVNIDKPNAGDHIGLVTYGETKWQCTSALAKGDQVTCTTSGYAIICTSGYWSVGKCVTGATSGGIANVYLYGGPTYINA